MPDCHPVSLVQEWNKFPMPEPVLYRIRVPSLVPECFSARLDAGMPTLVIFKMHRFFCIVFYSLHVICEESILAKTCWNISWSWPFLLVSVATRPFYLFQLPRGHFYLSQLPRGHFYLSQLPRGQSSRGRKSSPTITTASQVKMQNKKKITKIRVTDIIQW